MPSDKGYKNYCVPDIAYMCTWDEGSERKCEFHEPDPYDSYKKCRHHFNDGVCRSDEAQKDCKK